LRDNLLSVEPLVFGVEFRDWNIGYFHLADRSVAAAGFDEDRGHWFDWKELTIELHVACAFEDEVDFG
jgi:hypothetical protein